MERLLEVVDFTAFFELRGLLLEIDEVRSEMLVDLLFESLVLVGVVDDDREARLCVRDNTINVLLQVRVEPDRLDVFHSCLHVDQELVDA